MGMARRTSLAHDTTGHVGIWQCIMTYRPGTDLGGSGVDHEVVGIGTSTGRNVGCSVAPTIRPARRHLGDAQ